MKQRLLDTGLSEQVISWFNNYLSERKQCVYFEDSSSIFLKVLAWGAPRLSSILFTISVNLLGRNVPDAKFPLYADDTAIYCCGSTLVVALGKLKTNLNLVERQLIERKFILNTSKMKLIIFSNGRKVPKPLPSILYYY